MAPAPVSASQSLLVPTYARAPVAFERGEGPWAITADGTRYLDFGAGIAVNALGHAHPHLVKTLTEQAARIWHTSNLYSMPDGEKLARRLCEATFAERVFFTNSGAEANECAIKMARKYHAAKGHPERYHIVTFEGAFHGRTLATIAAGGQQKYIDGFGPKVDGFDQVPFDDEKALRAAIGPQTAALMIEPIQGEGGLRSVPPRFLKLLRQICDEQGLLLIFDEIQTGVGRTGKFFAHEHYGVMPDIMSIAKGIGGGFPMGACLATEEAASGMTLGTHGTTFGGNPLAMRAGIETIRIMEEQKLLENAANVGAHLKAALERELGGLPGVKEVRGQGLMLGIELDRPCGAILNRACDAGLLLSVTADSVIRLVPPLILSIAEADEIVAILAPIVKTFLSEPAPK